MPRATKEEKEARDTMVLQLFLAGRSYRVIGKAANLSKGMVCRIIKEQMRLAATRREYIAENAFDVYMERLEDLYAKAYVEATDKKLKPADRLRAMEQTRRFLDMMGRVQAVGDDASIPTAIPPDDGGGEDDDEDDELTQWRKSHG